MRDQRWRAVDFSTWWEMGKGAHAKTVENNSSFDHFRIDANENINRAPTYPVRKGPRGTFPPKAFLHTHHRIVCERRGTTESASI
jgi:hypothetical protein